MFQQNNPRKKLEGRKIWGQKQPRAGFEFLHGSRLHGKFKMSSDYELLQT